MSSLDTELQRLTLVIQRRALVALKVLMKTEVAPAILRNIMGAYDSEMQGRAPEGDKASPEAAVARAAFEKLIRSSLTNTLLREASSVSISTGDIGTLQLNLASSASGLERHLRTIGKNPWVLEWLVFYLEGFGGEFAFISKNTYDEFVKAGVLTPKSDFQFKKWGWYQSGFMISRSDYEAEGLGLVVPFALVRHPQSGMRPARVFDRAMDGIDMMDIYSRAFRVALGGV